MLGTESGGTQAGLFSAVSSAFIIDVQSKLEPDPNETTAAYMRILIHTMNNSLFPDTDPNSTAWAGPPPEIVTVQSLLYASLVTSLFAAFLAMLGKQWVNRYLRNRGGSAADKSRDRQRKLDGFEKWHFHLAIESLPAMLQLALLLLGCALSKYLWMISRTVAGVIVAVTLFGVASYVSLSPAAMLYRNCPYQTPPSIITRTVVRYMMQSDAPFARSLLSIAAFLPPIKLSLRRTFGCLRTGVRRALYSLGCISGVLEETEHLPLAIATSPPPARIFEDVCLSWEDYKADARCISWVLSSITDTDVIYSTVRFAADTIWYPETVGAMSPHILADLFFDCVADGKVIRGKSEHASLIGMALASVLSTQLTIEPENQALRELCQRIRHWLDWKPLLKPTFTPEPSFTLVVIALVSVANIPTNLSRSRSTNFGLFWNTPDNLSTAQRLWLSKIILQTLWRWRRVQESNTVLSLDAMEPICNGFIASNDQMLTFFKKNCFLTVAICLGLELDIRDLYVPSHGYVVSHRFLCIHSLRGSDMLDTAILHFHQQLRRSIWEGEATSYWLTKLLSTLSHLHPFQKADGEPYAFSWIANLLNSGYSDRERYLMVGEVVQLLGKWFDSNDPGCFPASRVPLLLDFLSLGEKFYGTESPHPGFIALRILSSCSLEYTIPGATLLPVLTSTLVPAHPLKSRSLALNVFYRFKNVWLSSWGENVPYVDLDELLQAVGDPFQFQDPPLQDGQSVVMADYEPMQCMVVLIGFAASDLWRNHLRHTNFTSCEEILSTEEGRRTILSCILETATDCRSEFLCTPAKIIVAVRRLEELRCLNTAEVMTLWAWTVGVVNTVDNDTWGLLERSTLNFYRAHGVGRLTALSRHITDTTMEDMHLIFLLVRYREPPCRAGSHRQFLPFKAARERLELENRYSEDLRVAQACQLRRLYHLFGCSPTTRKEAVAVEDVDEGVGMFPGRSVTSTQLMDWACDYP